MYNDHGNSSRCVRRKATIGLAGLFYAAVCHFYFYFYLYFYFTRYLPSTDTHVRNVIATVSVTGELDLWRREWEGERGTWRSRSRNRARTAQNRPDRTFYNATRVAANNLFSATCRAFLSEINKSVFVGRSVSVIFVDDNWKSREENVGGYYFWKHSWLGQTKYVWVTEGYNDLIYNLEYNTVIIIVIHLRNMVNYLRKITMKM